MPIRIAHICAAAVIGVLAAAVAAGASPESWHEPGTPEGGSVYSLVQGADGAYYAGTQAGLYTSRDGSTWQLAGAFPGAAGDAGVDGIAAPFGTTVYAASDGMLFKSTDGGRRWRRSDAGIRYVGAVGAAPGAPNVVFAGSWWPRAVYRSVDGGRTWMRTSYGIDEGGPPNAVVADPTAPDTVYVATANNPSDTEPVSGGVYKTVDGGAGWRQLSIGLPLSREVATIAIDPRSPQTLYAGLSSGGVFKSTDGGFRWRPSRLGLEDPEGGYAGVRAIAVDTFETQTVYAATSSGLMKSVDGGASWRRVGPREPGNASAVVADARVHGTLVAGSLDGGLLRSADHGEAWQPANGGLTALLVMAVAVDPASATSVYVGTYGSGMVATRDGGRTWSSVSAVAGTIVRSIAFAPTSPRTIYAAVDSRGVLKTVDGGRSWRRVNRGLGGSEVAAVAVDPRRPRIAYAAGYGDVFTTVNGGKSWRHSVGEPAGTMSSIAVDPSSPGTVYAAQDRFVVSRDGGKTWSRLPRGIPLDGEARALVVTRTGEVFAAVDLYGADDRYFGAGVYRLERGGDRWTRLSAGLPRRPDGKLAELRSLAAHPRTGAVCVGTNGGLFQLTRVRGTSRWRLVDPVFAGRTVRRIAFAPDGSRAYAATPGRLLVSR